jgi:muconolactone delta-isomerase
MKILAIEKEVPGIADDAFKPLLEVEARRAWELHQQGAIRELYFRKDRDEAVLVLECADIGEADKILQTLPLVKNRLIQFDLVPLKPYPGFERLFRKS